MLSNQEVGARIAARRSELGLTMEQLSETVGVAKSTIQRYERGSIVRMKVPVITAIAMALSINPAYLVGTSDDPYLPQDSEASNKLTPDSEDELEATARRYFESLSPERKAEAVNYIRYLADVEENQ
jgi:transcriptional regulator with XRE-family HTH domain